MHDIKPFMALMKELSFNFDINLPKPEIFSKVFTYKKVVLPSQNLTIFY